MKRKILIFDLDGTIADTIWSIRDGVNLAMDRNGFPHRDYDEVRQAIGNGARELIRLCLPEENRQNDALIDRVLSNYDELYATTYANVSGCYPQVRETIYELRDRGYVIAVLSNKQDTYVKKIIQLLFPDGTVTFAAGQTKLPRKPDPTVPKLIADMFGASPWECAFIGDSEVDVRTAKNAEMLSVACTWGYRPREALLDADHIIDTPQELLRIFE